MRTQFCGLIDESLIGQTVTLCGWVNTNRVQSHTVFSTWTSRRGRSSR